METKLELEKKLTLSAEEASELSGIGVNTIYRMMKNPRYKIVLWVGKRRRIKRAAFEQIIFFGSRNLSSQAEWMMV